MYETINLSNARIIYTKKIDRNKESTNRIFHVDSFQSQEFSTRFASIFPLLCFSRVSDGNISLER